MSTIVPEVPANEHPLPADANENQPTNDRLPALDVLRGLAVLGALFISIWVFGGFSNNQQSGLLLKSKGWDYRLFGTFSLLLEGKMRALISIVFGAGMVLYVARTTKAGQPSRPDLLMRRQLWLMLFGIINAVLLLWSQDVLFHLGIMGVLLFPFVRLAPRVLLVAALVTTLIYCGKNFWNYSDDRKTYNKYLAVVALEKKFTKDSADRAKKGLATAQAVKKDTLTKKQKEEKGAWEGLLAGMKYDAKKDDGNNKAMRSGSYAKVWEHLLPTIQGREAQWFYQTGIWDFASMIFLGMALLKLGFLGNGFSRNKHLLFAVTGITVGLLLGWLRLHHQQLTLQDYGKYISSHWYGYHNFFPIEKAALALGYTSMVMLLVNAGFARRLWQAFASVGRMALTNYLLQSICLTLFFAGFGMGYFGRLQQHQLYFVALELCMVQTIFSILWLRRFQYGPAEWLWQCLIEKKWLPIRKQQALHGPSISPAIS